MLSIACQSVIDWKDKIVPDLLSVQELMRHYEGQTPKVVLNALLNVAFFIMRHEATHVVQKTLLLVLSDCVHFEGKIKSHGKSFYQI